MLTRRKNERENEVGARVVSILGRVDGQLRPAPTAPNQKWRPSIISAFHKVRYFRVVIIYSQSIVDGFTLGLPSLAHQIHGRKHHYASIVLMPIMMIWKPHP